MRILVFTVSSWNSKVGSNTWAALLNGYDPSQVANICIRDEIPDSPVCSRYFGISENKIIKSVFNRKIKTGRETSALSSSASDNTDLEEHNTRYQKMTVKRRYSMLMARELVWKLGRWKTKELNDFLDDFHPDIILHSMEGYIHLNRIIEYAIKRTGARAVGYIWDDNFTYKQYKNLGYKVYRYFQRRSLKRLARKTDEFFAISPFTKSEADKFFGINCHVLTKPLSKIPTVTEYNGALPIRMVYTGNLLIGRDKSLIRLCRALKEVNSDREMICLDVYTKTVLPESVSAKLQSSYCHIHKPIMQSEALKKQNEADVLLFLEDIDGKDAKAARLSFSTKITDYLSAGKCIFAIGNCDTSPMQYFIENKAAIVCDSDEKILRGLNQLTENTSILNEYAKNACEAGKKNHDPQSIRKLLFGVLDCVYTKNKGK
ncbi:MAG: hypothetical protein PUF72_05170 [Clostridiales bacterium]|nr:hypothetical protein [Clostridiales bacterium]